MRDQHGRDILDLRVSLTDRCNLRCTYCVPASGIAPAPSQSLLRDEELLLLIRVAVELGIRKIRLTGGEPTLRPGVVELVRAVRAIPGLEDLAMTTNGLLLEHLAAPLAAAGLQRVNVSLDTLRAEKFRRISRGGKLDHVLAGIAAAESAGLRPVKINCVVVRGWNDDDVVPLAALTLHFPWEVRFIEVMPFGNVSAFAAAALVRSEETKAAVERALGPLEPLELSGENPARTYRLPWGAGVIGFVSSLSQPFCARCGRLRLTADGRLRLCLLQDDEVDLLTPLRRGASYEEIRACFRSAAFRRPLGGALAEQMSPGKRVMLQIGG